MYQIIFYYLKKTPFSKKYYAVNKTLNNSKTKTLICQISLFIKII